uniref:S-(hydroxymethyl)glutathione dehydrogenase n=1 Tax=Eutreptiella gymnastica TaxID=73025 RepID=A0A6T2HDZ2_9EUGL
MPEGQPITCKAMVAFGVNDLREEEIMVAPPKAGEVRVKVVCNALCHTDIYTLSGQDPEGLFPSILGHEAGAIVESVGEGVTSVKPGDSVVPGYTPQCKGSDCIFCMSPKTNLCPKIRGTQGKGVMPDGTSRFTLKKDGSTIWHFMGCSTFAEYTVLAEISVAKVNPAADLTKACLFGCGVSTGLGAVWNTMKVEPFSSVAVFGLGAVGLAVIQGAKAVGAKAIVGIDTNPKKFEMAKQLGCTLCLNPKGYDKPMQQVLVGESPTGYGWDYTFDCTGNTDVMRSALEAAHRGWGQCCLIGVAASGHEISTRPFQFITGRRCAGTAFGGWKTRDAIPMLVDREMKGDIPVGHYITHTFDGVAATTKAIEALHSGHCLRAVVKY